MELVVAPFDHKYPPAKPEVSVTVCPLVIIFDPLNVISGTVGGIQPFAITVIGSEVAVQPFVSVTVARYVPCVFIVMALVTSPFDHKYEFEIDEVSVTYGCNDESVSEPFAVIAGVTGEVKSATVCTADCAEQFGPL